MKKNQREQQEKRKLLNLKSNSLSQYKKKANLTVCLFLLCFSSQAQVSEPFTKRLNKDYKELISEYKFEIKNIVPLSSELVYLRSLKSTLDLLLLDNSENLDQYEDDLDLNINYLENLDDSDPSKLFFLAEIRLKSALSLFKFGHEFEAAWHFRQAYRNIQRNIKLFPEFTPNYKTSGAINILLGSVPEKHQWLLTLVGLKGSIEVGISQLDQLINSKSNFRNEAIMIKSLLQVYVLNQTELATNFFNASIDLEGSLIQLQKMVLHLKNSQGSEALAVFEKPHKYEQLAYSYYLAGDGYIQKGDYLNAELMYSRFLEQHRGSSNKKDALYKIWLCHYLSNDSEHPTYRESAKLVKEGKSESDKYASKVLSSEELPNIPIMKLRLATDGGFYGIAEKIVSEKPILLDKKDSVEYKYRLARLYHKRGDLKSCLELYKSVLDNINNEHWYFAPNSALMLGYIYLSKNELEFAKLYLTSAMSFKHHEYKNSIDAKAEAALNSISDL